MRKIPLAPRSFESLRSDDFAYVDKTRQVHDLIRHPRGRLFLSRPRRFGKTTLLSTLKQALRGRRDLFKGLWIEGSGHDFKPVPVIDIDFRTDGPVTAYDLKEQVAGRLKAVAAEYGLACKGRTPGLALAWLIRALHKKFREPVAVLVDDYDSPLAANFKEPSRAKEIAALIANIFSKLGPLDDLLRLVLVTGVARYRGDAPWPSGAGRPEDVTLDPAYAAACGFTAEELDLFLADHLEAALGQLQRSGQWPAGRTAADLRRAIVGRYDGHSWDGRTRVMNPFSVLSMLASGTFGDFWYLSGDPTLVVKRAESERLGQELFLEGKFLTPEENLVGIHDHPALPWLFQQGYLAVDRVEAQPADGGFGDPSGPYPDPHPDDDEEDAGPGPTRLVLRVPSLEVQSSLFAGLLAKEFNSGRIDFVLKALGILQKALLRLDPKAIELAVRRLTGGLRQPMHYSDQAYFHTVFYYILRSLGTHLDPLDKRFDGVVDAVVEPPGGDVLIVQARSADRSWQPGARAHPPKDNITWPWRAAPDRPLESWELPLEDEDSELIELDRILGLEAMLALKVIDDWEYPGRYLPQGRRVFKVGIGVFGRRRVRALVEEAFPEEEDEALDQDPPAAGVVGGS
jgi:hypothetical protein